MIEFERSVNQILWHSVMGELGQEGNDFENDTFAVRSYRWCDERNDWNFFHKPSGFKLQWYKYPLRSPIVNMEISHEQFLDVLRDCINSMKPHVHVECCEWWENPNMP